MDYEFKAKEIRIKIPSSNHDSRKLLLETVDWAQKRALDSLEEMKIGTWTHNGNSVIELMQQQFRDERNGR